MESSPFKRRGLFVTGTDTGVGKTVVCAALMHRFRALGGLRYWKPIQTGIEEDDDAASVAELGACRPEEIFPGRVRLPRPLSPHLAARLAGCRIDLGGLTAPWEAEQGGRWIVEGAGGALVPVNESELMTDLMARLGLPVLVVARSTLGTINHTLLTVEALRKRSLTVAGVVMAGEPNAENRAAIENYGGVRVVGEAPRFSPLSREPLERWACSLLDPEGLLEEFFCERSKQER